MNYRTNILFIKSLVGYSSKIPFFKTFERADNQKFFNKNIITCVCIFCLEAPCFTPSPSDLLHFKHKRSILETVGD